MIRSGLVSITFRKLTPERILRLVQDAHLDSIEWGGDVHVPHGHVERARQVRAMTVDAGVAVASYGSYYRVGVTREFSFGQVAETACALGAPVVRVWAGDRGSATADPAYRQRLAEESHRMAEEASAAGLRVAFEFHGNTLTDTTASALALLRQADHPALSLYWQPPRGLGDADLDLSLGQVLPVLANLHVFHWSDTGERQPLTAGRLRWERLFRIVARRPDLDAFAMIEFVRGDTEEAFQSDAACLRELLTGPGTPDRVPTPGGQQ